MQSTCCCKDISTNCTSTKVYRESHAVNTDNKSCLCCPFSIGLVQGKYLNVSVCSTVINRVGKRWLFIFSHLIFRQCWEVFLSVCHLMWRNNALPGLTFNVFAVEQVLMQMNPDWVLCMCGPLHARFRVEMIRVSHHYLHYAFHGLLISQHEDGRIYLHLSAECEEPWRILRRVYFGSDISERSIMHF